MNAKQRSEPIELIPLEEVNSDALEFFQAETAKQDPLFRPLTLVRYHQGYASLDEQGQVRGLAWRQVQSTGVYVDVRVRVQDRRRGVGKALIDALLNDDETVFSLCDSGQRSALRFFKAHAFQYTTTIFAYRWDGTVSEVPPTFQNAHLKSISNPYTYWQRHQRDYFDQMPLTLRTLSPKPDDPFISFEAYVEESRVGAITAVQGNQDFGVIHWWVEPDFRKRGIGRLLLCKLLNEVSPVGFGVVVHSDGKSQDLAPILSGLGFWVYRSWQCFKKEPSF